MNAVNRMVLIASLGGLLLGYQISASANVLGPESAAALLEHHRGVQVSTVTLIAAALGALVAGRLADLIGRRDVIMSTTALFTLGSFVSMVSPSVTMLVIGRGLVGLGIGAISVVVPLFIAEIAPAVERGRLIAVYYLMITLGMLAAALVDDLTWRLTDSWRYVFLTGALPGLLMSLLALSLVESPVWLALINDRDTAEVVLERLGRGHAIAEIEDLSATTRGCDLRDPVGQVLSRPARAALTICVGLFLVQQLTGFNALFFNSDAVVGNLSAEVGLARIEPDVLIAIVNTVAAAVAILLIDRVGRRPLLLTSVAGLAISLVVMAGGALVPTSYSDRLSTCAVILFVASFSIGVGPIAWVAAAEMLPIHLRAAAMGLTAASHWLFFCAVSASSPLLRSPVGQPLLLLVYAGIAAAAFVILRRRFPETRAMLLEDINLYFMAWAKSRVRDNVLVHYSVASVALTGGILTGFNFAITAVTLVLISGDWHLSALEQGALASTLLAGITFGSFSAGRLSDRFGRRYVLMSMAALFVTSALLSALAPSLGWLMLARAATGFAIGITAPTSGLYVAEVAPAHIRGRLLSLEAVTFTLGTIIAYCVGLAYENEANGWQVMFAFIAGPATFYAMALLFLPESPRWLAASGHASASRRASMRLSTPPVQIGSAPDAVPHIDAAPAKAPWSELFQPRHRPAVKAGLVIMFLMVFSGWEMVLFYAPTVLNEIGIVDNTQSFTATLGINIAFLAVTILGMSIVDRAGRKTTLVIGLIAMAGSLVCMAVLTIRLIAPSSVAIWGQVIFLGLFACTFALTVGLVGEIVIAEIYSQSIRGRATSLAFGMRSIFAIAFTLSFPVIIDVFGLGMVLLSYAAISLAGAAYLVRHLPETKGLSLEEIADEWKRHSSRDRGAEVAAPPSRTS